MTRVTYNKVLKLKKICTPVEIERKLTRVIKVSVSSKTIRAFHIFNALFGESSSSSKLIISKLCKIIHVQTVYV